jgi:predicted transcriptional regulator
MNIQNHATVKKAVINMVKIMMTHKHNPSVEDIASKTIEVMEDLGCLTDESNSQMESEELNPAVPIEDSIQENYIVCLEDGKRFKMMKRHLREQYGMTPDQYRNKWRLPNDYPMTAPNYSRFKSSYAKSNGLGKYERDVRAA